MFKMLLDCSHSLPSLHYAITYIFKAAYKYLSKLILSSLNFQMPKPWRNKRWSRLVIPICGALVPSLSPVSSSLVWWWVCLPQIVSAKPIPYMVIIVISSSTAIRKYIKTIKKTLQTHHILCLSDNFMLNITTARTSIC